MARNASTKTLEGSMPDVIAAKIDGSSFNYRLICNRLITIMAND